MDHNYQVSLLRSLSSRRRRMMFLSFTESTTHIVGIFLEINRVSVGIRESKLRAVDDREHAEGEAGGGVHVEGAGP